MGVRASPKISCCVAMLSPMCYLPDHSSGSLQGSSLSRSGLDPALSGSARPIPKFTTAQRLFHQDIRPASVHFGNSALLSNTLMQREIRRHEMEGDVRKHQNDLKLNTQLKAQHTHAQDWYEASRRELGVIKATSSNLQAEDKQRVELTNDRLRRGALATASSNMHQGLCDSATTNAVTHYATPTEVSDLNFQLRAAKHQQTEHEVQARQDSDLLWHHYKAQERGHDDFHTGFMQYDSRTLWNTPQRLGAEKDLEILANMVRLQKKGESAAGAAVVSRQSQAASLREASEIAVRISRAETDKERAEEIISSSTTDGRRKLGQEMRNSAVAEIDKLSELRREMLMNASLKANCAATMEEVASCPEKQPDEIYKTKRQPTRVGVSTLTSMMTKSEEMFHDVGTGSCLTSCKLRLDKLEEEIHADTNGDGLIDEFEEADMAQRVKPETWRQLAALHAKVVDILHAETDTGRQYSAPHHREAHRLLERMDRLRAGHVRF